MGLKSYFRQIDKDTGFKIFSWIFIISSAVFLFWRAKFGFGYNDEAFVITLGERLFDGDALLYDEWHVSQNFGVVMLPFFAFTKLFGIPNDSIILLLRYCYCFLWLGTCLCVYFTLNKKYKCSILVYAYLIFFAPFDMQSITYNSIGLMAMLLLCCLMYSLQDREKCPLTFKIYFSLLWIVAALCSPLMAVVYVLTFIASIIISKFRKGYAEKLRSCYLFSAPVIAVAVIVYFFVFIYSRSNMNNITEGFAYILDDPEHNGDKVIAWFLIRVYSVFQKNHLFLITVIITAVCAQFKMCREKFRLWLFSLNSLLFVIFQIIYIINPDKQSFNYHMLNIAFLGFAAFMLLENKPWKLFGIFYILGVSYTIVGNLSSNTGIMSISSTMTVSAVAGIICIFLLCKELREQYLNVNAIKMVSVTAVGVVMFVQISSSVYIRMTRAFWDDNMSELTEEVEFGSWKGIYTTHENLTEYESIIGNLNHLLAQTETKDKTFMSCTFYPSIYLDANLEIETFSVWTYPYDDPEVLNDRILQYQRLHDGAKPDLVYCYEENDILPLLSDGYDSIEYEGSYLFILKE